MSAVFALPALLWLAFLPFVGWTYGILTAFAAMFTGAAFGCYRTRKTERGVWMFAALVGGGSFLFYVLWIAMEIRDAIRNAVTPSWWIVADSIGALWFVGVTVRASWTVVKQNRRQFP